ncbi:hypothetical protein NC651_036020 [Populus alba x Populus x berolinensis]|nr:hypothetical protein NC651_036020 [Populus alba x Populus x berolinensis]
MNSWTSTSYKENRNHWHWAGEASNGGRGPRGGKDNKEFLAGASQQADGAASRAFTLIRKERQMGMHLGIIKGGKVARNSMQRERVIEGRSCQK